MPEVRDQPAAGVTRARAEAPLRPTYGAGPLYAACAGCCGNNPTTLVKSGVLVSSSWAQVSERGGANACDHHLDLLAAAGLEQPALAGLPDVGGLRAQH